MVSVFVPSNNVFPARWASALSELKEFVIDREELLQELNNAYKLYSSSHDYMYLREAFVSLFGVSAEVMVDGSLHEGVILSCPICGKKVTSVLLTEPGEDQGYQMQLFELMQHLYQEHGFSSLIEKVVPGSQGMRAVYRCRICGKQLRGVIEVVNHVCQHALNS